MVEVMREDAENGMSVIEEICNPIEEGIMESMCDVAIRTSGLLADYIRFTGRVWYIGGDKTVADPIDTAGSPSVSWRLVPGLVDESRWSVFPRPGLVWEDICHFPRWDVPTVASVVNQNAEIRGQVMESWSSFFVSQRGRSRCRKSSNVTGPFWRIRRMRYTLRR